MIQLQEIVEAIQPDFVFHLAAQSIVKTSYDNPCDTFSINVLGTVNILQSLRKIEKKCVAVMITSDKCYENVEWTWGYRENDHLGGKDPYSASKAAAECAIHAMQYSFFKGESPVRVVSVRAGNVIGGGDWAANRVVADAMRAWAANDAVLIRSPQSTRPWQHVLEPLSGYLRAGQILADSAVLNGESFNFGPRAEQTHTVLELLEELAERWQEGGGEQMIKVDAPANFHEAGLLKLNCDKALHALGWQPTLNYQETIKFTADWYVEYYRGDRKRIADFTLRQIEGYAAKAVERNIPWTI